MIGLKGGAPDRGDVHPPRAGELYVEGAALVGLEPATEPATHPAAVSEGIDVSRHDHVDAGHLPG